jgi:hypothetical protein
MAVPYTFGSATTSIPLSQLDSNFATTITLGNTAIQLGNTVTTLNNMTLGNVTINSGTSNIQTNVANATGVLIEANGGTGTTTGYYGFKNRIINGAMVIDQRNAGASVSVSSGTSGYTADRWFYEYAGSATGVTVQQVTDAPTGFSNSIKITVGTGASVAAGNYLDFEQKIEGFNTIDFAFGTASASTITLSFWVKSSITGTYSVCLQNASAGATRGYTTTYTINSANTWEQKSITVAGDTSGTWVGASNACSLNLVLFAGAGSSYQTSTLNSWRSGGFAIANTVTNTIISTSGATIQWSGVQLEKGSTATSFDYRPYGTELALCQRYFVQYFGTSLYEYAPCYLNGFNTTNAYGWIQVPVPMRASPSVSASTFLINDETGPKVGTSLAIYTASQSNKLVSVLAQAASGITVNRAYNLIANNSTSAYIQISSEL